MKKTHIIAVIAVFTAFLSQGAHGESLLEQAFYYLKKYDKTGDRAYRHLFEDTLAEAAEEGDPEAQYQYYMFARHKPYKGYEYSDVNFNDSLSFVYLNKAAATGHVEASGELGLKLYNPGDLYQYIDQDIPKSITYLKLAESTNNPEIDLILGYHYLGQADSVKGSYEKAVKSFEKAEKHGGKKYYWDAIGGKAAAYLFSGKNKEAAALYKTWLNKQKKAVEYEEKNRYNIDWNKIDANYRNTPHMYDYSLAIEAFVRTGDYESLNLIPLMEKGYYTRFTKYPEKNIKFDFNSWKETDPDYSQKENLLTLTESYCLWKLSPEKVNNWESLRLLYGANQNPDGNHCYRRSQIQNKLGNRAAENEYLLKGYEQKDFKSSLELGTRYFYGDNVDKDPGKAYTYLQPAEEIILNRKQSLEAQDLAKGSYLLANLYYTNDLPESDWGKAVEFANMFLVYEKYAPQGLAGDIYQMLGRCYRFGRGVENDEEKADFYTAKAATLGQSDAATVMEWLRKNENMPPI